MASHLSDLLHLFIDAYVRDADALRIRILDIEPINLDAVSPEDQLILLAEADREAQDEILRKTLIDTKTEQKHHANFQEESQDLSESAGLLSLKDKFDAIRAYHLKQAELAASLGLTDSAYAELQQRRALATKDIAAQMLRFFANNLDELSDVIERLDETNFNELIPNHLVAPFRECHINFVLGNYGASLILCGALLERALQDLLPSGSLLNDLIKEAKGADVGLLKDRYRLSADRIRDDRNDAAHGRIMFDQITSHRAWETIIHTRLLIAELYKDRLN